MFTSVEVLEKVLNIRKYDRYLRFISNIVSKLGDEYVETHHILPKSVFPDFEFVPENLIKLSAREHYIAHWMLWKIFDGKMCFAFYAFNNQKSNDRTSIRYNSKAYEHVKLSAMKLLSEFKRGKAAYKNATGDIIFVSKDDVRVVTGEYSSVQKGKLSWFHNIDGNSILTTKLDIRVISGEYIHSNLCKAGYIDKNGISMQLYTDDLRVISGEFVAISKGRKCSEDNKVNSRKRYAGTVVVKDTQGNTFRASITDDRYLSGELVSANLGVSKISTDKYSLAAKNRKKLICPYCGKAVACNVYERFHNTKCKMNPNNTMKFIKLKEVK